MRPIARTVLLRAAATLLAVGAALLSPAAPSGAVACPAFEPDLITAAALDGSGLREVSGIQSSLDHPGVLWVVQDSGNGRYLYALDAGGHILATYLLDVWNVRNVDWEAIALDPRDGTDLLYIGDIGDNAPNRDGVQRPTPALYQLPEPEVSASQAAVTGTITKVAKFPIRYFSTNAAWRLQPRNAESLFVDPRTHDVFVILKDLERSDGVSKLARVLELHDEDLRTGSVNHAVTVAKIVGAGDGVSTGPVSADESSRGDWIAVKNYVEGFLWPRGQGQSVGAALAAAPVAPCRFPVDSSEAITFGYSDLGAWTSFVSLKESKDGTPPLHVLRRLGV